jgi:hypothetical protein
LKPSQKLRAALDGAGGARYSARARRAMRGNY